MNRRSSFLIVAGIVLLVGIGLYFFVPKYEAGRPKYAREASRAVVDISQTEFYLKLKQGKSAINETMGGFWIPVSMPIPEKYQNLLMEKLVFIPADEGIGKFSQIIIMDSYSKEAFSSVSTYLKTHSKELRDKNPKGKIKILHDGTKGIIYQWRIPNDEGGTKYMEIGKVCMTDDGVFSVKYINKGTSDIETQRQRIFKFFGKVS